MSETTPMTFEEFWQQNFAQTHAEERRREQELADEAFLGASHTVCGFLVRGMAPFDLHLLSAYDNPFIAGGVAKKEDVAQVLLLLAEKKPTYWERKRMLRHIRDGELSDQVAEVNRFVDRMFMSSGIKRTENGTDADAKILAPLPLCFLAPMVLELAGATGWSEDHIMAMRLDKLFQYRRQIREKNGGKEVLAPSDGLLSRALQAYNEYRANIPQ